jgi:hypothetical protein
MRYEVAADGSLRNGAVFLSAEGEKANGGPDGVNLFERDKAHGVTAAGRELRRQV